MFQSVFALALTGLGLALALFRTFAFWDYICGLSLPSGTLNYPTVCALTLGLADEVHGARSECLEV